MQITLSTEFTVLLVWLGLTSFAAFLCFGYDKWQAGRGGGRVAEFTLCLISALGGWPGGLLGILVFRHKSAKGSFQLKFAAAFVIWAALLYGAWRLKGTAEGQSVGLVQAGDHRDSPAGNSLSASSSWLHLETIESRNS